MFERLEVSNVKSFNWKLLINIVIAGFIGELCVFLIIYMGRFDYLKQYEKIDVTVGLMGLITTFLGAYFGAKIAGSESRKLFKQELKMNDLSKNMDINLDVLEKIEYVKKKINFINNLIRDNTCIEPNGLKQLQTTSSEINETLIKVKDEYLSQTSIILYSDIRIFYENFNQYNNEIKRFINYDETRKLIKSVEKNDIPIESINLWENYFVDNNKNIFLLFNNDKGEEISEKISVDLIIKKNKVFFDDKKEKVEKIFDNVNQSFNNMKYKNRDDLIKEYTKLYKD